MNKFTASLIGALLVFCANPGVTAGERDTFFGMSIERVIAGVDQFEDEGVSIKAAGGYMFSQYVGFEMHYRDYGELKDEIPMVVADANGIAVTVDAEQTVKRKEFMLYLIGNLPVTGTVDIYAKVGRSKYNEKYERDIPGFPDESFEVKDYLTFYSLGARLGMDEDSAIRLEYEAPDDDSDSYLISFGFIHLF